MGVILFTVAIMPAKGSAFPQTRCPPSVSQEPVLIPPLPARTRPGFGEQGTGYDLGVHRREITKAPASEYSLVGYSLEGVGMKERKGGEPREGGQPWNKLFESGVPNPQDLMPDDLRYS